MAQAYRCKLDLLVVTFVKMIDDFVRIRMISLKGEFSGFAGSFRPIFVQLRKVCSYGRNQTGDIKRKHQL